MAPSRALLVLALLNVASASVDDAVPERTGDDVTPVNKVVELLDVLLKQVEADGRADGGAHVLYTAWYHNQTTHDKRVIEATTETIATLSTNIEEQKAFQASEALRLDRTAGEVASAEADLEAAKQQRQQELESFQQAETTLVDSVDSLQRSLEVLGKQMPASAPSASLVEVAKHLKETLLQTGDIQLNAAQRETLDGFLRQAGKAKWAKRLTGSDVSARLGRALMPDFLQVKEETAGPYGDYETQSGGVTSTLQSVLSTTEGQLSDAREAESTAKGLFTTLATNLQAEVDNKKITMSQIKTQVAQSQERTSQMEAQLAAAQNLLKVTQEYLAQVEAQYARKCSDYKLRVDKRSDEIMAVREASQLLTTDIAKKLLTTDGTQPTSFLQIGQDRLKGKALRMLKAATTPAVALLAVKMETHRMHHGHHRAHGPFDKVSALIRDMLRKLQDEHQKEAEHNEWCVKETKESLTSQKSKNATLVKLGDRIGAWQAESEQLVSDLAQITQDVADMKESVKAAAEARSAEKTRNIAAIQQYKDAQELLTTAIEVLKKFYNSDAAQEKDNNDDDKEDAEDYKAQTGMGTGVIGILEVALADFTELAKELEQAESESDKEFKELASESDIKAATFGKDLEYKTRNKVKLDGDTMRANQDVKNTQKELDAVSAYLDKLHEECVGKGETYEERKVKREKELASLKEAMAALAAQA